MPFQSVPECAEVVIKATVENLPVFNVLNFWKPGGYDIVDLDALTLAVDTAWSSYFLADLHTSYLYQGAFGKGLELINDIQSSSVAGAGAGSASGDGFPNNVAFVLTFRTGLTGRSARGRAYIGGIPASATTTNNTVFSSFAAAMVADMGQVKTAAVGAGWQLVVVSRITGGALRPLGVHNAVTSIVARNTELDSQRRRLPRGH